MPSLAHYMSRYDHEHCAGWKALHEVGIPVIFVGAVLLILMKWIWGSTFLVGGWVLLLLGHRIEGNHPAFFQEPVYFLVGPIWVMKEFWTFLTGRLHSAESEGSKSAKS